jgi:hypothetical protein
MAVPTCEHIKGDGVRCGSPAMCRRPFCYMHWRLRDYKLPVTDATYEIPSIDSEATVVLVSAQIMRAVFNGKLDARQARIAVSCLNLAAQAMRNQLNVSGRTVVDLTPAMDEHFATAHIAASEFAKKPPTSIPTIQACESDKSCATSTENEPCCADTQNEPCGPGTIGRQGRAATIGEHHSETATISEETLTLIARHCLRPGRPLGLIDTARLFCKVISGQRIRSRSRPAAYFAKLAAPAFASELARVAEVSKER